MVRSSWSIVIAVASSMVILSCRKAPIESGIGDNRSEVRGMTVVDWTADGYDRRKAADAVRCIAATGARQLVILVTVYQTSPSSSMLYDQASTSMLLTERGVQ